MSCTGQKGVVSAIMPEQDLPLVITSGFVGVPNLFLHPSFLKRQTASVVLEGINRHAKLVEFPHLERALNHGKTEILLQRGLAEFTGNAICGKSGKKFTESVSIYELSYQVLSQHCAVEKCYATTEMSLKARDPLTGQLRKGKSHFGAAGLSSMDVDALLGHGATSVLTECMFSRSDDAIVEEKRRDPIRIGASAVRYFDDQRLLNFGMGLEIRPRVCPPPPNGDEKEVKRSKME